MFCLALRSALVIILPAVGVGLRRRAGRRAAARNRWEDGTIARTIGYREIARMIQYKIMVVPASEDQLVIRFFYSFAHEVWLTEIKRGPFNRP